MKYVSQPLSEGIDQLASFWVWGSGTKMVTDKNSQEWMFLGIHLSWACDSKTCYHDPLSIIFIQFRNIYMESVYFVFNYPLFLFNLSTGFPSSPSYTISFADQVSQCPIDCCRPRLQWKIRRRSLMQLQPARTGLPLFYSYATSKDQSHAAYKFISCFF